MYSVYVRLFIAMFIATLEIKNKNPGGQRKQRHIGRQHAPQVSPLCVPAGESSSSLTMRLDFFRRRPRDDMPRFASAAVDDTTACVDDSPSDDRRRLDSDAGLARSLELCALSGLCCCAASSWPRRLGAICCSPIDVDEPGGSVNERPTLGG